MLDALAAILRFALYAGLLSGAGTMLAMTSLDQLAPAPAAERTIRIGAGVALAATIAGILLLLVRLGGFDSGTLSAVFQGPPGLAAGLQVVSSALLILMAQGDSLAGAVRLVGAVLALASFAVNGHAAASGFGSAVVAFGHVSLVAWWIGALWLLRSACATHATADLSLLVKRFTSQATLLVILLLVIGGLLLGLLVQFDPQRLLTPYGLGFAAKLALVAMALAVVARNRFWIAPRLSAGEESASAVFRRSVTIELAILALVLAATAALTNWTSPHS